MVSHANSGAVPSPTTRTQLVHVRLPHGRCLSSFSVSFCGGRQSLLMAEEAARQGLWATSIQAYQKAFVLNPLPSSEEALDGYYLALANRALLECKTQSRKKRGIVFMLSSFCGYAGTILEQASWRCRWCRSSNTIRGQRLGSFCPREGTRTER